MDSPTSPDSVTFQNHVNGLGLYFNVGKISVDLTEEINEYRNDNHALQNSSWIFRDGNINPQALELKTRELVLQGEEREIKAKESFSQFQTSINELKQQMSNEKTNRESTLRLGQNYQIDYNMRVNRYNQIYYNCVDYFHKITANPKHVNKLLGLTDMIIKANTQNIHQQFQVLNLHFNTEKQAKLIKQGYDDRSTITCLNLQISKLEEINGFLTTFENWRTSYYNQLQGEGILREAYEIESLFQWVNNSIREPEVGASLSWEDHRAISSASQLFWHDQGQQHVHGARQFWEQALQGQAPDSRGNRLWANSSQEIVGRFVQLLNEEINMSYYLAKVWNKQKLREQQDLTRAKKTKDEFWQRYQQICTEEETAIQATINGLCPGKGEKIKQDKDFCHLDHKRERILNKIKDREDNPQQTRGFQDNGGNEDKKTLEKLKTELKEIQKAMLSKYPIFFHSNVEDIRQEFEPTKRERYKEMQTYKINYREKKQLFHVSINEQSIIKKDEKDRFFEIRKQYMHYIYEILSRK